jgi:ribosome-associated protein
VPPDSADGDLVSASGLRLPAAALSWRFSRAAGPGGQHVNTADTRVELLADLSRLEGPPGGVERARNVLGDELRVVASSERSQLQNRLEARRRLAHRLDAAARPRRTRRRTVPPKGAVEARLRDKRAVAERKSSRNEARRPEE